MLVHLHIFLIFFQSFFEAEFLGRKSCETTATTTTPKTTVSTGSQTDTILVLFQPGTELTPLTSFGEPASELDAEEFVQEEVVKTENFASETEASECDGSEEPKKKRSRQGRFKTKSDVKIFFTCVNHEKPKTMATTFKQLKVRFLI